MCSIQWGFDEVDDKHFCFESYYFSMGLCWVQWFIWEGPSFKDGGPS